MSNNKQRGFNLIELMIVVTIIGIIAAIAYPSYQNSVRKARRADAQTKLLELANYLERKYTEVNSYAGITLPFTSSPTTGTAYYTLSFSSTPTAQTFTLQATPIGGQAADSCGTLSLSHLGTKTPSTGCW